MKVSIYSIQKLPEHIKEQIGADLYPFDGYFCILVVEKDEKVIFWESDNMEPEDVSFTRDLSWVPEIIEKVYELGKKQGYDEQLEEAYNASRDFPDFKLGPAK